MSKKGENIYKRKDGRWEARYRTGYLPNGRIRYGYCYARTYRAVKDKVSALQSTGHSLQSHGACTERKPLHEFCDEWLQLKRSNIKSSTYVKYWTVLENHIKPALGRYAISALNALQIEQFGYALLHMEALSAKTVKDILTVLHAVLAYVEKQVPSLPHIEVVYPKEEKKEMRVLTREEQARFTAYLLTQTDPCKFGTLLALLTGMRIGEICALRWRDISLPEGAVRVEHTMQRIKNLAGNSAAKTTVQISSPKSAFSARVIPLSAFALTLCRRFYQSPECYVLTGDRVRYMEPRALQYRMERYAADCGLDGVHFHTLRHSFATRCVEVGFEIKSLSEILGHANPQITLTRYVHSSMELKRLNMDKLAALGY